jgi:hypothetical protein
LTWSESGKRTNNWRELRSFLFYFTHSNICDSKHCWKSWFIPRSIWDHSPGCG